jgi:SAM-dependent methyltransferase
MTPALTIRNDVHKSGGYSNAGGLRADAVYGELRGEEILAEHTWLNVASSTYVLENFINLDDHPVFHLLPLYPVLHPFLTKPKRTWFQDFKAAQRRATLIRHDCRKRLPFRSETVDHVLCSHFLEHVYPDEAMTILQDFRRVLKTGGTMHLVVPSLDHLVDTYKTADEARPDAADKLLADSILTHATRPGARVRLLEFLGFEGMKHRWMYTQRSLSGRVEQLGFRLLSENTTPSAHVRANDGPSSLHVVAKKVQAGC